MNPTISHPDGTTEVRTEWGDTLRVHDSGLPRDFYETGVFWSFESARVMAAVRPGWTVIDVGASYGLLSCPMARRAGPEGLVVACEANPRSAALLRANAARNGHRNLRVQEAAVGERAGTGVLYENPAHAVLSSLQKTNVPSPAERHAVRVVTLDDTAAALAPGRKVDMLKVDVEGMEGAVLRGGRRLLERDLPRIWLEFWPDGLERCGDDPRAVLAGLVGLGYSFAVCDLVKGEVRPAAGPADVIAAVDAQRATFPADSPLEGLQALVYLDCTPPA